MPKISPDRFREIHTKPKSKNRRKRKPWRERTPDASLARAARKREKKQKSGGASAQVAEAKLRLMRYGGLTQYQKVVAANGLREALIRTHESLSTPEGEKEMRALAEHLGFQDIPSLEEVEAELRRLLRGGKGMGRLRRLAAAKTS